MHVKFECTVFTFTFCTNTLAVIHIIKSTITTIVILLFTLSIPALVTTSSWKKIFQSLSVSEYLNLSLSITHTHTHVNVFSAFM